MLEDVIKFAGVVSAVVTVLKVFVMNPFIAKLEATNATIVTLTKSMDRLVELLDVTRQEQNDMRERLAKLEASTSSAHKRIDDYFK